MCCLSFGWSYLNEEGQSCFLKRCLHLHREVGPSAESKPLSSPVGVVSVGWGASGLWPPQAGRRRRCPPDEEPELRQARCMRLAAEGELSRACAALVAPPMLSDDDGVHSALRAKHPRAHPARPSLVQLGPPSPALVPDISAEDVVAAVRSFRGSAPGPTGLRGDHLREALQSAHGTRSLPTLP